MNKVLLAQAMLAAAMTSPSPVGQEEFIILGPVRDDPEDQLLLQCPEAILPKKPHVVRRENERNPYGKGSRRSSLKATSQRAPKGAILGRRVHAYS